MISAHLSGLRRYSVTGLVAAFALSSCNCGDELQAVECDFTVAPLTDIDFGEVAVGGETARTIRLENTGTVPLDEFSFLFSERNGEHYDTPAGEDFSVGVGQFDTLSVIFAPLAASTNLPVTLTISHPQGAGSACPAFALSLDGDGFIRDIGDGDDDPDMDDPDMDDPDMDDPDMDDPDMDDPDMDDPDMDDPDMDDPDMDDDDDEVVTPPDVEMNLLPNTEWQARGALQVSRSSFASVLLEDGDVLIVGGYDQTGQATAAVERLDPLTGISRHVGDMAMARAEPSAVRLSSGKVAIVGGRSELVGGVMVKTLELFDPATDGILCAGGQGTCDISDNDDGIFAQGRLGPIVTSTSSTADQLVVAFGTAFIGGERVALQGAERVDLTQAIPAVVNISGATGNPRLGAWHVVGLDGSFAVGGGLNMMGSNTDIFVYSASQNDVTPLVLGSANRVFGAAALHLDGTVVVVGGQTDSGAPQQTVERIDDIFGTNPTVVDVGVSVSDRRHGHVLALAGGLTLIAGGTTENTLTLADGSSYLPRSDAELLIPVGGGTLVAATDNELATPRIFGTSLVLSDAAQQAIFIGGTSTFPRRTSHPAVELFSVDGTRFRTFGLMGTGSAKALIGTPAGGALLSAGGLDPHTRALSERAIMFDLDSDEFVDVPDLVQPRSDFSITALAAPGVYLVAGGRGTNGEAIASLSLYVPIANPEGFDAVLPIQLTLPRAEHSATLLDDGRILLCGGIGSGGAALDTCELFTPPDAPLNMATYDTATIDLISPSRLSAGRFSHTATKLTDGTVLFVGGGDVETDLVPADIFDPLTDALVSTGQPVFARRSHVASRLNDGRVLLAGGEVYLGGLAPTDTAELYDPVAGTFALTEPMSTGRILPGKVKFADGTVLISGGTDFGSGAFPMRSLRGAELFTPSATGGEFDGVDVPLSYGRSDIFSFDDFGVGVAAGGHRRDGLQTSGSEHRTPLFFVERLIEDPEGDE